MTTETVSTSIFTHLQQAFGAVIPVAVNLLRMQSIGDSFVQEDMSVLIALTGDMPSHIIVEAPTRVFSGISERMFGMALEGEMLESFAGELANMVAGTTATNSATEGINLNIGPPVVIVGQSKLTGFHNGTTAEVDLTDVGSAKVSLIWE